MAAQNAPSIWSTMSYVPPRGQCNYKQSIVSPKCPCLRFMLHPLKSSSSYECDGCTHHASFHSMENKQEDEIRKRWEQEAKEKQERDEGSAARPKKRLREIEYNGAEATPSIFQRMLEGVQNKIDEEATSEGTGRSSRGTTAGRSKKKGAVSRATKTKGRLVEGDEDYIELD